ncbi:DUF4158 domain-containing protein [Actinacidiphila soli]|uniref:DUF4158 domain-containing protein n=1 Tax=Actinacidiphila soli TaxID=2487275 RepID=UPI0013E3A721|nr:DUF4158 domain-containing protein [Actinacidiphila soli]
MRQEWSPEELLASWTLVEGGWKLVANKTGATRLGFCLMLKFFEIEARFPEFVEEFPQPAVEYVAGLVKVPATELSKYDLAGAKRHRKQIREVLGFRPPTLEDEEQLTVWLAAEVCPVELVEDRQREALLVECRARSIKPPGASRIEKVLVAARNRWERAFCARAIERLREVGVARLLALVAEGNEDGAALLALLKRDPGAVGLDSLLAEINKLNDGGNSGCPRGCSRTARRSWWPRGGRERSRCTPRTSATPPRTYASRCSRRCVPPGRRRSPMPWWICWSQLVNATFAARDTAWWGQGTAYASDSKKFGSWSSNFMTEYHARYNWSRSGFPGALPRRVAACQQLNRHLQAEPQGCRIPTVITGFLERFV